MKSALKGYNTDTFAFRIGNNIQKARVDAEGKGSVTLTQAELAQMLNQRDQQLKLNARTIGKIERGERMVNVRELVAISAVLGMSVQELLTGEQPKYAKIEETYGLGEDALQALKALRKDKRCASEALNMVLEDKQLIKVLAESLVLYAEAQMLAINPLMGKSEDNFIYVDSKMGDEIMKQVALHKLTRLLECVRKKWELKYYPTLKSDYKKLLKLKKGESPDADTIERLKRKLKDRKRKEQGYPVVDVTDINRECDAILTKVEKQLSKKMDKQRMCFRIELLRAIMEDAEEELK